MPGCFDGIASIDIIAIGRWFPVYIRNLFLYHYFLDSFGIVGIEGQNVEDQDRFTDLQIIHFHLKRYASYAPAVPGLFRTLLSV